MRDAGAGRRAATARSAMAASSGARQRHTSSHHAPQRLGSGHDRDASARASSRRDRLSALISMKFFSGLAGRGERRRGRLAGAAATFAGSLRPVNHKDGCELAGTDRTSCHAHLRDRTDRPRRAGRRARRAAPARFSLRRRRDACGAHRRRRSLQAIGGIDALIALQGVEDPTERRRAGRQARARPRSTPSTRCKLGAAGGHARPGGAAAAEVGRAGLKDASGDPGLDRVLAEIELRVAGRARQASPP